MAFRLSDGAPPRRVSLPLLNISMHPFLTAGVCPSFKDTPFCRGCCWCRFYSASQGAKNYVLGALAPALGALVQRKRSVAVELQVGVLRLEDGAYSRVHCFDGREKAGSQSRYDHGGGSNRNTLSSLVDGVSPDNP